MDISRKVDFMNAREAGVERALGMSMLKYSVLAEEHPKRAKKVMKRAMQRLAEGMD